MRVAIVLLIVLALPFAGLWAWRLFKGIKHDPWPILNLVVIGLILSVITMVTMTLTSIEGDESSGKYVLQRLQDGEVQPGGFESDEEDKP